MNSTIITFVATAPGAVGAGVWIFRAGMNYAFGVMARYNTVEELKAFQEQMNFEREIRRLYIGP